MPYRSKQQAAFIHAQCAKGVKWACEWIKENHGQKVGNLPSYTPKKGK